MKNTGLLILLTLFGFFLITSCEKEEVDINESTVQNYRGFKGHKIKLCIQKGNGDWHGIEVAKNAMDAHLSKGAVEPGTCMEEGLKMSQECIIIEVEEIPDNGIDDDCDGLMDCDDPDLENHETCNVGCPSGTILARQMQYKSLYLSTHDLDNYSSEFMNGQLWAIQYCENLNEPGYEDWRLGTLEEYQNFDQMCDGVYRPNDRRPSGLPSVPLITADMEMKSPYDLDPYYRNYSGEEVTDIEVPLLFSKSNSYSSSYGVNYMILCMHDN